MSPKMSKLSPKPRISWGIFDIWAKGVPSAHYLMAINWDTHHFLSNSISIYIGS